MLSASARADVPVPRGAGAAAPGAAGTKERHREALIAAAAELLVEQGPGYSVEAVAERAGVSRRTVFNHVASLDDLTVEVGVRELEAILAEYDRTVADLPPTDRPLMDDLEDTLGRMDLVPAVARLTRMLDPDSEAGRTLLERALALFTPHLVATARAQHPDADPFERELIVAHLTSGLVVVQRHWAARTGAAVSVDSRAVWDELVHALVERMRSGHAPGEHESGEHAPGEHAQGGHAPGEHARTGRAPIEDLPEGSRRG